MLSLSKAIISALLFTSTLAGPVERRLVHHADDIPHENRLAVEKRQAAPFAVTGVTGNAANLPLRQEIRNLAANADQWNMFLLGLQRLQSVNQSDLLSYFQVAGIHGRPEIAWNGVQGNPNSPNPGYCTHVSNLFLPWHRPYLALYEQVLQAHAMDAANEFPAGPVRDQYVAAAQNVRLPYWDWAMDAPNGGNSIPDVLTNPQVTVTTPNGSQTIQNPLASYNFHPRDPGLSNRIFIQWPSTLRWPSSQLPDAVTQTDQLVSALNGNQQQYKQRLFNLLTQYNDFMNFTNEPYIKAAGPLQQDSLESLHDSVHSSVGGQNYGHMSVIDVAAFDPIFWLHHAMIDRVFALWQALYPNSYVEPQKQFQSSYWYNQGDTEDVNSSLLPFHLDGSGNFWTSASVRDHTQFGYTYSELQSGQESDVVAAINKLYGNGNSSLSKRSPVMASTNGTASTNSSSNSREYLCNIHAPKNALDGSFFVHFFLGDFSSEPADWAHDPALVGTYGVTATKDASTMGPVTVSGTIPLTVALQKAQADGKLADLSDTSVTPYLAQNLHWKVQNSDGSEVDPTKIPDFAIAVVSTGIQPAGSAIEFPKWTGDIITHTEVTC